MEEMLVFLSGGTGLLLWAAGLPAVLLAVWAATGRERLAPFRVRMLICAALLYLSFESVAKPIFKRIIHSPKYGTIEKL